MGMRAPRPGVYSLEQIRFLRDVVRASMLDCMVPPNMDRWNG